MSNLDLSRSRRVVPAVNATPQPFIGRTQPVFEPPPPASDSLSLADYLVMLYRHKGTLLLLTAVGALLAIAVSILQPRLYQSKAVLEIQPPNEDFLNLAEISPTAQTATSFGESYMQTQAEILRQDSLINRVVKKTRLDEHPDYMPRPSLWQNSLAMIGFNPSSSPPADQYATKRVQDELRIIPARESRIIEINFAAADPELAAQVANTISQTFIEQSVTARWNAAQEVREWLRPQLDELRSKLEQSQGELQAYLRDSGLQLTSGQENLAEGKLRLVQAELARAQGDRVAKQSVYYAAVNSQPEAIAENPVVQEYRLRLTELRRQAADLNTVLMPESYKLTRLNAQIAELEGALQKELANNLNRLRDDHLASLDRESQLEQAYNQQWAQISSISSKMVHYETLKKEVDTTRQFYEAMMLKANEAGIASVIRPSNVRLVSPGQPPIRPHRPNVPLNLSIGTFVGLLLGIGVITLREQTARCVCLPGDTQLYLSVPELGAIPAARHGQERKLLGPMDTDGRLELVSWERKLSGLSESFRGTVTSILLSPFSGTGTAPRVLVVTSALPGEGKTTIAINLAITLAGLGRRVLLMDCDLRRPRLHDVFELANSTGISTLLRDRAPLQDLPLEAIARKTRIPNLSVLLSGPGTDEIASLLYSPRMEELMARIRGEFDHVLIDAPPSLNYSDSRLLGRQADGVVLVVRANHTKEKTALAVVQRFLMDGVPVLGTILNAWNPRMSTVYGYQGYGYYERDVDAA